MTKLRILSTRFLYEIMQTEHAENQLKMEGKKSKILEKMHTKENKQ